jgi:HPt (histidine-containing phosphotransfer) domain-containing protein
MKVFDEESALERVDGDKDFLMELFNIAIEDSATRLKNIEEAINSGEAKKIATESHAMKSAMGNIGAMLCHAACLKLETLGKSNSLENIAIELANLKNQIELFKLEIEKFKSS